MANRRLQSLLEANKRGLTLRYDPPASRNLCFYRCLSKFVDVKEEDIVQMVQRHFTVQSNRNMCQRIFLKLNFKGRAFGINTLLSYRG